MKGLTETDFKYLAGLIDSDGWCSLNFQKSTSTGRVYLQLTMGVGASDNIDKDGSLINWLGGICGRLSQYKDAQGVLVRVWTVSKRNELAQIVPRLVKHMVIKAKHIDRLYSFYLANIGNPLTEQDIKLLKAASHASRLDSGPLKAKNFASRAWTAGFLDGDGHYGFHKRARDNYIRLSIDALSSEHDKIGLELLKKTYGGEIHYQDGNPRWYRGLGKQHRAFAIDFLKVMHSHSRLKKHKIEQMLSFHNLAATTK